MFILLSLFLTVSNYPEFAIHRPTPLSGSSATLVLDLDLKKLTSWNPGLFHRHSIVIGQRGYR